MNRYDDISRIAGKATLGPIPPSEPDGAQAIFDGRLEEYDRLLKA